jgi:enoyl-CoA hydratase
MASDSASGAGESERPASGVRLTRSGALALATLERPERKNAISRAMVRDLSAWFPPLARDPQVYAVLIGSALERAFSVGGDVKDLLALARADLPEARRALAAELALCWLQECFSKPTVSLIDGTVMGTGVGITIYGTHRVAGEGYRFAMPETAIGYVPDCGVAHAFARMPHAIGLYLGLTGAAVGRADALALGLATHCIARHEFDAVRAQLADADPVDPVLDARHADPGHGPIMENAARIERYFDAPFLTDVVGRLERPRVGDEAWAAETLAVLRARSPLACCLTFRAIVAAAGLDIRETLQQDFRLAWRLLEEPDFHAGVAAVLIDRTGRPQWRHARIEEVPAGLIETFFAPLGVDEMALPTRLQMQAARV